MNRFIKHTLEEKYNVHTKRILSKTMEFTSVRYLESCLYQADYKPDFCIFIKSSDNWNVVLVEIENHRRNILKTTLQLFMQTSILLCSK